MLQLKPKTISEFKDALQLIRSAVQQKAIDGERLPQATAGICVSAESIFWTHLM